ncbi:hypothetical protein GOP47_0009745 [Adiantum capillus-veneris]|uniref:Uncharacterized protein n=1 Tax=Adiantum capillus-veneris TaxID=13818 RepID=A0A9D4ZHI1_ADICA|nr:hypothetical protein GOP47_0009745 [Adiantum capillus-veneris]
MSITVREKLILKQEEIEYGIQENEADFLGMLYMNGKVGRCRSMVNRKRKVLDDLTAVVDEYYTNDLEDDVSDTETKKNTDDYKLDDRKEDAEIRTEGVADFSLGSTLRDIYLVPTKTQETQMRTQQII